MNFPEQEVGGSDNEDKDEIVKYSTDSDSDECISGDDLSDWRCYCKHGKSSINR